MLVALESIGIKRKCKNIFSLVIEAMNKNNEIMVKGYGSPRCKSRLKIIATKFKSRLKIVTT
jgi:hypothetical protein